MKKRFLFLLILLINILYAQDDCGCFSGGKQVPCPDDATITKLAFDAIKEHKSFSSNGVEVQAAQYSNPRIFKYRTRQTVLNSEGIEINRTFNKVTVLYDVTRFYENYEYNGGSISIGEIGGESESSGNVKKKVIAKTGVAYADVIFKDQGAVAGMTGGAMFEDDAFFGVTLIKTGPTSAELDPCGPYIRNKEYCEPGWCTPVQKSEVSGKIRLLTIQNPGHEPFIQKIVIVPDKNVTEEWYLNTKINLHLYDNSRNQFILTPALSANQLIYEMESDKGLELQLDKNGEIVFEMLPHLGILSYASKVPETGVHLPEHGNPLKFKYLVEAVFPDGTKAEAEKELSIEHIATITDIRARQPDITNGLAVIKNDFIRKLEDIHPDSDPGGHLNPHDRTSKLLRSSERVRYSTPDMTGSIDPSDPAGQILKIGQKLLPGDRVYVNACGLETVPLEARPSLMYDGFIEVHIRFIDGLEGIFKMQGRNDHWAIGKFVVNGNAKETGFQPGYIQAVSGIIDYVIDDIGDEIVKGGIKGGIWALRYAGKKAFAYRFMTLRNLARAGQSLFKSTLTLYNIYDKLEKIPKLWHGIKWMNGAHGQFIVVKSELVAMQSTYGLQISVNEGQPLVLTNENPQGIELRPGITCIFEDNGKYSVQETPAAVQSWMLGQLAILDSTVFPINYNKFADDTSQTTLDFSAHEDNWTYWILIAFILLIHLLTFASKKPKLIGFLLLLDILIGVLWYFW